ncbi:MAG TPA: hypothetical protein VHD56_10790, partial [Tepidisphaeraceae bacterium]|nr:hypothetical protein [Tepidisphaeraceae bacterium]
MRSGRLGIGVLFISALLNSFAQADPKVEEQILAPAGNGSSIIISEHGVHVAVVGLNGSRMGVSIDGVAGPVVDQILLPNGQPFGGGNTVGVSTVGDIALPVLFSPNGDHYAYAAKIGNDAVIFHDGKEITRGPYNASVLNFGPLCFSPSGKHLFFILTDTAGGVKRQFMMDGKPVSILPQENPPAVYFSPDESRYMYYAMSEDHSRSTLVVDGKDSGYFGNHLRFSSDNKVLCVNVVNGK